MGRVCNELITSMWQGGGEGWGVDLSGNDGGSVGGWDTSSGKLEELVYLFLTAE